VQVPKASKPSRWKPGSYLLETLSLVKSNMLEEQEEQGPTGLKHTEVAIRYWKKKRKGEVPSCRSCITILYNYRQEGKF